MAVIFYFIMFIILTRIAWDSKEDYAERQQLHQQGLGPYPTTWMAFKNMIVQLSWLTYTIAGVVAAIG